MVSHCLRLSLRSGIHFRIALYLALAGLLSSPGWLTPQLFAQSGCVSLEPACPPKPPLEIGVIPVPDTVRSSMTTVQFNVTGLSGSPSTTVTAWGTKVTYAQIWTERSGNAEGLRGNANLTLSEGTGYVVVQVCDNSICDSDSTLVTYAPLPTPPGRNAPTVSVEAGGASRRSFAGCAGCAYATLHYSTPSYRSLDQDRSLSLVYSSALSAPMGLVVLDVNPNSLTLPDRLTISLLDRGTLVPLTVGQTKAWYQVTSGTNRLTAQFDASGYATGIYDMTATVEARWNSDNLVLQTQIPVRVLIRNERTSGIGSGWVVTGVPRLHRSASGHAAISEDGGMLLYLGNGAGGWASPPGEQTTLVAVGSEVERRSPDGTVARFDANGYLKRIVRRRGDSTVFGHDGFGRLSTVRDPAGLTTTIAWTGSPGTSSTAEIATPSMGTARKSKISINATGQLIEILDPDNLPALAMTYVNHRVATATNRIGGVSDYAYDAYGALASVTAPQITTDDLGATRPVLAVGSREMALLPTPGYGGSTANPGAAVTPQTVWLKTRGPRGDSTRVSSTGAGLPTKIVSRDQLGVRDSVMVSYKDDVLPWIMTGATGAATEYEWSGGNLVAETDHTSGVVTRYMHNGLGQVTTVHVDDQLRRQNFYSTGIASNLDSSKVGTAVTKYTYDATGRPLSVTDPGQHVTTFAYQAGGYKNLWYTTAAGRSTTMSYDIYGRPMTVSGPTGKTDSVSYDLLNRTSKAVEAGTYTSTWTYNDAGRAYTFTDAKGQSYQTELNAAGAPTKKRDPRLQSEYLRWNSGGQLSSSTSRAGRATTNTYDPRGRLTMSNANGAITTTVYDTLGRFTVHANAESIDSVFVEGGWVERVVTVRGGRTYEVKPYYGPAGERRQVTVAGIQGALFWRVLATHTDSLGRADGIGAFGVNELAGVTYDAEHRPKTITYPKGTAYARLETTRSYGYDDLLGSVVANHAPQVLNWQFGHDPLGRLEYSTQGVTDAGWDQNATRRWAQYDVAGRLTRWNDTQIQPGQPEMICEDPFDLWSCYQYIPTEETVVRDSSYTYDAVGNRTDLGAMSETGNRLVLFDGYTMTYDADGNMTSKSGRDTTYLYQWNELGQLAQVTRNGAVTSFGYDAFGRRVRKTTAAGTTSYLYDGANLVMQLDGAGMPALEFSYHPNGGKPYAVRRSSDGASFYYHTTVQGHVSALTNAGNQVVNTYAYTPFGKSLGNAEQITQPLQYGGRYFDRETGLYYNGARYYDPALGRFISEDPIGLNGGVNPYVYAGNDPVNYSDPTGLCRRMVEIEYINLGDGNILIVGYGRYFEIGDDCGGPPKPNPDDAPTPADRLPGVCSVPVAPPGVDVRENMNALSPLRFTPNGATLYVFYDHVKGKGPWDYKQLGKNAGQTASPYEDFGNFNYGAAGTAAGIPAAILLRAAGWASIRADASMRRFGHPLDKRGSYGDDPSDQVQIQRGIDYAKAVKAGRCR